LLDRGVQCHLLASCSNCFVSTTNFASFSMFLGLDIINLKSFECLPIDCANVCHSLPYVLHSKRKCHIDSVTSIPRFSRQELHLVFSRFLILCRNLLTEACPVRICTIQLVCFLVRLSLALLKFDMGNWSSMQENLSWWGEFFHCVFHLSFKRSWNSCFMADVFFGRGWCRKCGSTLVMLVLPIAANLVSSSAISFPCTLLCANIHEILISVRSALSRALYSFEVSSIKVRNSLRIDWEDLALGFVTDCITPWLYE